MKSEEKIKRPPLGLVPKYIHESKRHNEVCEAITRYYQEGLEIPIEWIEEYNQYIRSKNQSNISTT